MANGFVNDKFNAGQITATAFDGAYSVGVPGGWVSNLGITYAAGVLSVAGANGSALSASNPAYAIMQSKTAGALKKYTIIENMAFTIANMTNNLFGETTSIAYASTIPFFLYLVCNDSETDVIATLCRVPGMSTSPVAAEIGAPDDAVANAQFSMFSYKNIDETLYNSNPCIMIGSDRMTMSAIDVWTVTALTAQDGIGKFQEGKVFSMPVGTRGAAAGTYIYTSGGTATIFTTNSY